MVGAAARVGAPVAHATSGDLIGPGAIVTGESERTGVAGTAPAGGGYRGRRGRAPILKKPMPYVPGTNVADDAPPAKSVVKGKPKAQAVEVELGRALTQQAEAEDAEAFEMAGLVTLIVALSDD